MRCNSRAGLHHVFANAPPRPALASATAHTELLNLSSNLAARIALIAGGKVPWTLGLLMALSSVLGGQLCAHLALRAGARAIRPLLLAVASLLTATLLSDPANPLRVWIAGLL